jgi:hypothetical protein
MCTKFELFPESISYKTPKVIRTQDSDAITDVNLPVLNGLGLDSLTAGICVNDKFTGYII